MDSVSRYDLVKAIIDHEIALTSDQELHSNPQRHEALIHQLNALIRTIVEEYDGQFTLNSSLGNATHNIIINIKVSIEKS